MTGGNETPNEQWGILSPWQPWTECSVECGFYGLQTSHRFCDGAKLCSDGYGRKKIQVRWSVSPSRRPSLRTKEKTSLFVFVSLSGRRRIQLFSSVYPLVRLSVLSLWTTENTGSFCFVTVYGLLDNAHIISLTSIIFSGAFAASRTALHPAPRCTLHCVVPYTSLHHALRYTVHCVALCTALHHALRYTVHCAALCTAPHRALRLTTSYVPLGR